MATKRRPRRKLNDRLLQEVYVVLADTTIEHPISHLIRERGWDPMSAAQYVRAAWSQFAAQLGTEGPAR